ncbi:MAG TPA: hypothetical protein VGG74_32200 [Kofleriaceae bacterium]|jgi:hypothetical protein
MTDDPARTQTIALMRKGSVRPIRRVLAELAQPNELDVLVDRIAEFITHRPLWRLRGALHQDSVLLRIKEKFASTSDSGFLNDLAVKPVVPGTLRYHVMLLLQEEYGDSVDVFEFLAGQTGMNGVAYYDKLVNAMARIAERPDWIDDPKTMFDGSFLRAVKDYLAAGYLLKEIGGLTWTILDVYEWAFQEPDLTRSGFGDVQRGRYDVCYDLGGGFTTQYLAIRFGQPLICLDLFDPATRSDHEREPVARQYKKLGLAFDTKACPFQAFDVYTDRYPLDRDKYLITSFGFLGSTPGDVSGGRGDDAFPSFSTLYAAMRGIGELIVAGKDVTLAVYGRPSATRFSNICWTLHFDRGRLVTGNTMTADFYVDKFMYKEFAGRRWSSYHPVAFP